MSSTYILDNYPALGTYFWIETFEDLPLEKISEISEMVKKEITDFENNYSRFKKDSILTKFNVEGKISQAPYDLIEMVKISIKIAEITDNVFNICLLNQIENSGYDSELTFKEKFLEHPEIIPTSEVVTISDSNLILKKDYRLDLGGIGKGYLIDKISKILSEKCKLKYFLINGGGDIFITSDNENPVEIHLQDPFNSSEFIGSVFLKNQSLCGSSPFKRFWVGDKSGQNYSHIIDPLNKNKMNSSFVVGRDAVTCDTIATALCIDENCIDSFNEVVFLVLDSGGKVIKNTF
jgi:thiamine biosynthesis lipoprotein